MTARLLVLTIQKPTLSVCAWAQAYGLPLTTGMAANWQWLRETSGLTRKREQCVKAYYQELLKEANVLISQNAPNGANGIRR